MMLKGHIYLCNISNMLVLFTCKLDSLSVANKGLGSNTCGSNRFDIPLTQAFLTELY